MERKIIAPSIVPRKIPEKDMCKLCGIRATASVFRWLAAAALSA
jgi:hypothetical protein